MRNRASVVVAALLLAVVACSDDPGGDAAPSIGPGADSPQAAVQQLLTLLESGDFPAAASLAMPDQAALASLAEGTTVAEVANALRDGDGVVAANFWSGFAQSISGVLDTGLTVTGATGVEVEGETFNVVDLETSTGGQRQLVTREADGHRIDLFATFGPTLAGRLYSPVERLLTSPVEDAVLVLAEMRKQVPSLYMAAQAPDLTPGAIQEVLRLIELISRVS
ncbi:MAG: hypothetical protein OEM39_08090 [Acidimicrobiia bacterium]|nr:hypothetical protein [Acidimicrobiia bacterium]MDH3463472.1 hypothetical protein [Acidimicrobiia bacterium]